MKHRSLRLPRLRRPDPVLTPDELDFIGMEMRTIIADCEAQMAHKRVSESVIRRKRDAESVLEKVELAGAWKPKGET